MLWQLSRKPKDKLCKIVQIKRNGRFSSFKVKTLAHDERGGWSAPEAPLNLKNDQRHPKCCIPLRFASPVRLNRKAPPLKWKSQESDPWSWRSSSCSPSRHLHPSTTDVHVFRWGVSVLLWPLRLLSLIEETKQTTLKSQMIKLLRRLQKFADRNWSSTEKLLIDAVKLLSCSSGFTFKSAGTSSVFPLTLTDVLKSYRGDAPCPSRWAVSFTHPLSAQTHNTDMSPSSKTIKNLTLCCIRTAMHRSFFTTCNLLSNLIPCAPF